MEALGHAESFLEVSLGPPIGQPRRNRPVPLGFHLRPPRGDFCGVLGFPEGSTGVFQGRPQSKVEVSLRFRLVPVTADFRERVSPEVPLNSPERETSAKSRGFPRCSAGVLRWEDFREAFSFLQVPPGSSCVFLGGRNPKFKSSSNFAGLRPGVNFSEICKFASSFAGFLSGKASAKL